MRPRAGTIPEGLRRHYGAGVHDESFDLIVRNHMFNHAVRLDLYVDGPSTASLVV